MRLQGKFLALLIPAGLSAAVLILMLIHVSVHSIIVHDLEQGVLTMTESSAQDLAPALRDGNETELLPRLQSLQRGAAAAYAAAVNADGLIVADTSVTEKGKRLPGAAAALSSGEPIVRLGSSRGEPLVEISVAVRPASEAVSQDVFLLSGDAAPAAPVGLLEVGVPLAPTIRTERRIFRYTVMIVLSIGGLALGLVLWLVRGILKPVSVLSRGLEEIARGGRGIAIPVFSKDELGDLARSFNVMSVELARTTVSKEYVEGILDHMADFLFVVDLDGRIEKVNEAAQDALAYPAQEMIGAPLATIFQEEDASLARGEVREKEVALKTKTGRIIPALYSSAALNDRGGALRGYVGVAKDMTERKRVEAELMAAKTAAETAGAELEAFSYSVAHDLRAPVRAIDGFSQALLEGYSEKLDEEGRDFLGRVRGGSRRMGQLIDDLLNLSKVTRSAMKRERFDLSQLAREIAEQLKNSQPDRAVEFVITPDLQTDGDPNLLRAALENLLGNAWKYTKKHPRARIEFGETVKDGRKAFFVRDDGAGFDMAFAKKLFKAFSRLHSASEFEGTGIGLATVHRIMARHGGQIWGEGQVERGSTFYFTLPGGTV